MSSRCSRSIGKGVRTAASTKASSAALRRLLVSPEFLLRVESDPPRTRGRTRAVSDQRCRARVAAVVLPVEQHSRRGAAEAGGAEAARRSGGARSADSPDDRRSRASPRSSSDSPGSGCFSRNLAAAIPVQQSFPDFDDTLRQAFRRETELFFESVIREDRSALDLLRADYTFVNERLARHYGIANVKGSRFRRVELGPDSMRGGLLGQGSILTVTSYPDRTSPVVRGKWILENLLGVAAAGAAAERPRAQAADVCRAGAVDARAHRAASEEPDLRELPRDDGPARSGARELRRRRQVAGARRVGRADRRIGRDARRDEVRRPGRAEARAARIGPVRHHADREADDVRARPRRRVLRRAGGSRDRPRIGRHRVPVVVVDSRGRAERAVSDAEERPLLLSASSCSSSHD